MLKDADRTLTRWLESLLPPGTGVRFGPPDGQWTDPARAGGAPFVAAFLHGVRREDQAPQSSWTDVRDESGRVVGRQAPLQHFRLTYLLTAWVPEGGEGDDASLRAWREHELLGLLIHACAVHEAVPPECVEGSLAAAGAPTLVLCAPTAPGTAEPPWTGWGISPRTYLRLDLLAPLLPPMAVELAPPVRELALGTEDSTGTGASAATRGREGERRLVRPPAAISRPSPSRS